MQPGTYRIIPVKASKRHTVFALVSPEDYERFAHYRWYLLDGYARRAAPRKIRGPQRGHLMHREILGLEHGDPRQTDHINHDRLDNRRENLRVASARDNRCNAAPRGGTSAFRGVSWYKPGGVWRAQATIDGVKHYLGSFTDEDVAARIVNEFWLARGYEGPNDLRNGCVAPSCLPLGLRAAADAAA